MEFIIIYVIVLIGVYLLLKNKLNNLTNLTETIFNQNQNQNQNENQNINTSNNNITYRTILFCYNFVKYAIQNNYTKKFQNDVWILTTLMFQEAGSLVLNKRNEDIIGDNNNSIGYFQINVNGAFKEINKKYNLTYTKNDLKNKFINIYYASSYFYEGIKDYFLFESDIYKIAWIGAKRYNGGLDEKYNRKENLRAVKYADRFIKNMNIVKEYIIGIENE